jgi:hypothetical protein
VVPRQQDAHQLLAVVQVAVVLELQPQILTLTLQMVLVLLETTALVETDIRATSLEQISTTQVVEAVAVM